MCLFDHVVFLTDFTGLCKYTPCENGATCISEKDGSAYKCLCVPGYTGEDCETGMFVYVLVVQRAF